MVGGVDDMTLADKFRRMYATTKEEIVQDVKETFEKIIENSKTDNIHTAAYYHVYEKLVKEFLEKEQFYLRGWRIFGNMNIQFHIQE